MSFAKRWTRNALSVRMITACSASQNVCCSACCISSSVQSGTMALTLSFAADSRAWPRGLPAMFSKSSCQTHCSHQKAGCSLCLVFLKSQSAPCSHAVGPFAVTCRPFLPRRCAQQIAARQLHACNGTQAAKDPKPACMGVLFELDACDLTLAAYSRPCPQAGLEPAGKHHASCQAATVCTARTAISACPCTCDVHSIFSLSSMAITAVDGVAAGSSAPLLAPCIGKHIRGWAYRVCSATRCPQQHSSRGYARFNAVSMLTCAAITACIALQLAC